MSKNETEINRITTIEKIKNKLESLGISQEKGSIIYSGNETLRNSIHYFFQMIWYWLSFMKINITHI